MKNTLSLFALTIFLKSIFPMNELKGQEKDTAKTKNDEIEVTLASYFFETDEKTIEIIENKEHLNCEEYIDLALAYANLFADTYKIDSLITKSFSANRHRACEFWMHLLKNPKKHQITYQYFYTVNSNTNGCKDE